LFNIPFERDFGTTCSYVTHSRLSKRSPQMMHLYPANGQLSGGLVVAASVAGGATQTVFKGGTVSGTLLVDLSEGRDLEGAVKSFEAMVAPVLPAASTSNGSVSAKLPEQINPASNSPILLKDVRVSGQSPAADFMNESMIWAGILGAAAIALGGLVGFNTIRARKEPKDDFFFEA